MCRKNENRFGASMTNQTSKARLCDHVLLLYSGSPRKADVGTFAEVVPIQQQRKCVSSQKKRVELLM